MTTLSIPSSQTDRFSSVHGRAFGAISEALDLSSGGRDPVENATALSGEERAIFLKMLARLLQRGVVGTEILHVNGRPRETFVSTRMADPELAHARPYRPGEHLDRRV